MPAMALRDQVRSLLAAIFLIALSTDADACDEGDGNTLAMAACALEQEESAQAKLDTAWNRIAQSYSDRPNDPVWLALQRSQMTWEAYLHAECNDYVTERFSAASIRPVMVIGCRTQLKLQRYCSLVPPNAMKERADKETCGKLN